MKTAEEWLGSIEFHEALRDLEHCGPEENGRMKKFIQEVQKDAIEEAVADIKPYWAPEVRNEVIARMMSHEAQVQ